MSLGCPPPCAWKIVDGVVRMNASFSFSSEEEGGGLKRDCWSGGREVRGVMLVMGAVWVCFEPSFWYKGSVRAASADVAILMGVLVLRGPRRGRSRGGGSADWNRYALLGSSLDGGSGRIGRTVLGSLQGVERQPFIVLNTPLMVVIDMHSRVT